MNNVHTKIQAANEGRLARFVRHGVIAVALACSAAGAMAEGQDRGQRREEMQQQAMRDRYEMRAQEMRDEARMRQEQAMRDSMREEGGRRGRMTPDERSELKRQINEANRDLYPNARRR